MIILFAMSPRSPMIRRLTQSRNRSASTNRANKKAINCRNGEQSDSRHLVLMYRGFRVSYLLSVYILDAHHLFLAQTAMTTITMIKAPAPVNTNIVVLSEPVAVPNASR